jgi:polyhydroxyalkanoate synthase
MTVDVQERNGTGARPAVRSALDVMLTEAATEPSGVGRFIRPSAAGKVVASLTRRPGRVGRRLGDLGDELSRVVAGSSEIAPAKSDRRFNDRGYSENWLLRRVMQAYLAAVGTVDGLIGDADLDWRTERQARFAADNILDALAPTNFPWSNPAVLRETIDRGGANLLKGGRRAIRDMARAPRLPASVDTTKFEVGGNLALTPGSVVLRTEAFELIQYKPTAPLVREVPLLLIPPTINRYYVLDIAPGRSMIEWLVGQGMQVFMVSWRNPDAEQGHFDLDTYAQAVLEAREAVASITKQPAVHLNAACSGGIITAATVAHLAAAERLAGVAGLTLFVCALDNERAGTVSALGSRELAAAAVAESARKGYLDGRALAGVFAWLRPNDLVWNYVVNNYLMGKAPPAFDILYWNQDTVRLAAGLHREFIRLALDNSLTRAAGVSVLGAPVDLGQVDVDSYIVAGINDHIVPWENAYRSAELLGGQSRFVLSTSGHIQALVNPLGRVGSESRSSYRVTDETHDDLEAWVKQADVKRGSWWSDYIEWLAARSGDEVAAPKTLGNSKYKATAKAPGTYVRAA